MVEEKIKGAGRLFALNVYFQRGCVKNWENTFGGLRTNVENRVDLQYTMEVYKHHKRILRDILYVLLHETCWRFADYQQYTNDTVTTSFENVSDAYVL